MDTSGDILEHSKEKLAVYGAYLEKYLSIMLLSGNYFKGVSVYDIFAGQGISANGEEGSAVIAKNIIIKLQNAGAKKPIKLYLNDYDEKYYENLKEHTVNETFVSITNDDANSFISSLLINKDSHNLFFIDPTGYTQINSANIKKLFTFENSDFLFFIPTNHIYRFLKTKEGGPLDFKSINSFIKDMDIDEKDAIGSSSLDEFEKTIVRGLRDKIHTKFVYKYPLSKDGANSQHCLFFATRNILGAKKFLESMVKIQESKVLQLSLQFGKGAFKEKVIEYLKVAPLNNCEMYEKFIIDGIIPVLKDLSDLEKKGTISVECIKSFNRKSKGFYVTQDAYKEYPKIIMRLLQEDVF